MVTVEGEGGCVCHLVMCSSAGRSFSAKKDFNICLVLDPSGELGK